MAIVRGICLHVNGESYDVKIDAARSPYDVTREMIGDWTERVNILQVGDRMLTMWVDEQGHLKHLPVNPKASQFYPAPGRGTPGNPPIVGTVVFILMEQYWTNEGPDLRAVDMTDEARNLLPGVGNG